MTLLARFFSLVLHPFIMPALGWVLVFFFSPLHLLPDSSKWYILGVVVLFTLLLPMGCIFYLYSKKYIRKASLEDRQERIIPYLFTIVCYGISAIVLYKMRLPLWAVAIMAGATISLVVSFVITLGWKISAHAAGIGGVTAIIFGLSTLFFSIPLPLSVGVIAAAGLLCSSRIWLNRHTLGQVIAGFINGFLFIYIGMLLLGVFS